MTCSINMLREPELSELDKAVLVAVMVVLSEEEK